MTLENGDHLWLHHAGPKPGPGANRVILLHGLSGCADWHYMAGLQRVLAEHGFPSTILNARGAFKPNDRARSYHAGETGDLDRPANGSRARKGQVLQSCISARRTARLTVE